MLTKYIKIEISDKRTFLLSLLFISCNLLSQTKIKQSNYNNLSKFTIGVHKTFPEKANFMNESAINNSSISQYSAKRFFLDYRVFSYRNNALKFGLFLNKNKLGINTKSNIFNTFTESYQAVESAQISGKNTFDQIELYLNYSYLQKITPKLMLEINLGLSYEKNFAIKTYVTTGGFIDDDMVTTQDYFYSFYQTNNEFLRYNIAPSIGYKTDYGMFNLGVKYSIPTKKLIKDGQYEFYDPGADKRYYGFFNLSGKYLSVTLSYTPSKNLFKKKK